MDNGIINSELFVGVVTYISASLVKINLASAGKMSGEYMNQSRYGKGEVGEIVIIEGQQCINLAKIIEVKTPEFERGKIDQDFIKSPRSIDAIAIAQILASIDYVSLKVIAGVVAYPRIGDKVYSTPDKFLANIPRLINRSVLEDESNITIHLGKTSGNSACDVRIPPEKLISRHCAILGSTGGGKSWTTAKIIDECTQFKGAKIILLDPTGEYRDFPDKYTRHTHFGDPVNRAGTSTKIKIPPTDFNESDFIALFEPAGKVQGPKLRAAIRSLRLVQLAPDLFPEGYIKKIQQSKEIYRKALNTKVDGIPNSTLVDNPSQPFDVSRLITQIGEECCYITARDDSSRWGPDDGNYAYCSSLLTRIQAVTFSKSLKPIFTKESIQELSTVIREFLDGEKSLLRICLSDVSHEFGARELIANAVGRKFLSMARENLFLEKPVLLVVDEAHNFLGKSTGFEENAIKLDAFEIIAKEGRKYGLNVCITTQRPRDITEGVLSQIGTMLVHRLTNDRDRDLVERASGEIDRSSSGFLPSLKQGEVILIGVDFPIPMSIQMGRPAYPPKSDSPDFQKLWSK